ncbi:hypothetical protein C8R45DRAFT_1219369 [Mycena sanguinolenta]|nr:hypothetical protein C8R45DRAFT_1219369 [Mycena sanguinolenta]
MTINGVSVHAIFAEQSERTRQSSKADIEQFIEESEHKVISLESQISALRDHERSCVDPLEDITLQIHTLVELCDHERSCIDSLRYIISPIRTLPMELLVEIFELAIDDETHMADTHRISQICSDWRKIAHSTPRLWTRPIYIDLNVNGGQGQLYVDGMEAWLARSAPLPIAVSLKGSRENFNPCMLELLQHVLGIAPRLRCLRCYPWLFGRLAECRLDSLEELELGRSHSDDKPAESPELIMAPRLRKLTWTLDRNEHIRLPWAQLTDLRIDAYSMDCILDILSQCTTLASAALLSNGYRVRTTGRPRISLSHLHTLSLHVGWPQHLTQFLGAVSVCIGDIVSGFFPHGGGGYCVVVSWTLDIVLDAVAKHHPAQNPGRALPCTRAH